MKDYAQEWLTNLEKPLTTFYDNSHRNDNVVSFIHIFKEKFSTTKQKATWQKQLFEIKQGTDTINIYIRYFKQLKERVDPNNVFPASVMIQFFIQELRLEYAMNV